MALLRAASASDPITSVVMDAFERSAPILRDVDFYTRTGAAHNVKKSPSGATSSIFRNLNAANSPTPGTREYQLVTKKIISFDSKVDKVIEHRNEDIEEEQVQQLREESDDAGYLVQEVFFSGDVASEAKEFDGMLNLVDASHVDSELTVVPVGNSDANRALQQQAVERFINFSSKIRGGATHAYMNNMLKARWITVAKELGYYNLSKDELGEMVEMIGDVIIRGAWHDKAGNNLLPFNELIGGNAATSPIIYSRWGEGIDLTALTSQGVVVDDNGKVGNFYEMNVNLDASLVLQNKHALHVAKGWALEE